MSVQPIQFLAQLIYNDGAGINVQLPQISSAVYAAIVGTNYAQESFTVPTTSGGTALPLGGLASLGWAIFINLDATNYVEIYSAVSGVAIIKLKAGESALFRFGSGVTAPAAKANTATVKLQYLILEP